MTNINSRILYKYKNKISGPYRAQRIGNLRQHLGIDIIGHNGNPNNNMGYSDYIIAHSEGEVVAVEKKYTGYQAGVYGNYVKIKHANGMYTLYAHLCYGSISVSVGTRVLQGEIIGYMGKTGYANGVHLHFEVRDKDNKKIDPTPYINGDLPNLNEETKNDESELTDDELLLLVKRTIRGDFGNDFTRKAKLGENYSIVMKQVNLNYKNKTTRWDNVRLY